MTVLKGAVRGDGTSSLIQGGIYDMASAPQEPMSPELEARVNALLKSVDPRESAARFKLEVFFAGGPRRDTARGVISCWTNGGYLNGGGDAAVYLCPQVLDSGRVCLAPLDLQFSTGGRVVCTHCERVSKADDLVGQIINDVPLQRWAEILVTLFHKLECSADLRICVARGSQQQAIEAEFKEKKHGAAYAKLAAGREWIAYRLADIIRDTSSGSGLEKRFRAFLEA